MDEEEAELIIGTYEDYVLGHEIIFPTKTKSSNGEQTKKKLKTNGNGDSKEQTQQIYLEQSFAVRAHSGSVRAIASNASGSYVFSAGHDEMTNLFDLKKRKLIQTVEGAVNCTTFVGNSHLICGSEDGNIYIHELKKSNMIKMKTLRGHESGIISLDAHPSGKVLLSLSKDNTMRTWNLIKGRCAYVTNIKTQAHLVKWSKTGNEFLVALKDEVYLYESTGSLIRNIKLSRRVNSVEFVDENILVIACDSGRLDFVNIQKDGDQPILKLDAHETRIKSVACVHLGAASSEAHEEKSSGANSKTLLASASSDGVVKLWSISRLKDSLKMPKELAKIELGARITFMIAAVRKR